tara:strand:+ start:599 stop:997 length:399 start_codon:yes stop_codon:yes gene_type:complete
MKNQIFSIFLLIMLTGCYHQSLSLVGPAAGASQGKVTQSYLSTALNYAIKEKTGKNTLEHVFTREKEKMVKKVTHVKEELFKVAPKLVKKQKEKQELDTNEGMKSSKITKLDIKRVSKEHFGHKPRFSYRNN